MCALQECIEYVKEKYGITQLTEQDLQFIEDCYYLKINGETAYNMGLQCTVIWTLVIAWISENQNKYNKEI